MGKFYYRILSLFFYGSLVICGVCRMFLVLGFIDHNTGFYTKSNAFVYLLNAVLLVTVVTVFCLTRLRRAGGDYPVQRNNTLSRLLCLLGGISIIVLMSFEIPAIHASREAVNLLGKISGYGSILFGFLSGIGLFVLGFLGFVRREDSVPGLLLLCPPIWQLLLLIFKFNSYSTITTMPDNLLIVLFMIFNTLFFVGHARTVSNLGRNDGRNYTVPAGICSSLFGLLLVVPNYAFMIVNQAPMPVASLGFYESICYFLLSLYAASYSLSLIRSIQSV